MARPGDRSLLLAFFLSGAAALGYEIVWTRLATIALGSEILAVYGVLAGFFGGMAIGAAALHRIARTAARPVVLFAVLELCSAIWAAASPWLLHGLGRVLPPVLGPVAHGDVGGPALVVTLVVAGLVLLPGTFGLGATLAALAEARRRVADDEPHGRGLGRLYAANTLGATAGVLGAVHLVLPGLGLGLGMLAFAALGIAAAATAMAWERKTAVPSSTATDGPGPAVDLSRDPDGELLAEPFVIHLVAFGTGLAGVGLEVVGVQILAQSLQNTIYTFAATLAVYLLGTAAGAAIYQGFAARATAGRPATVGGALLLATALSTVLSGFGLAVAGDLVAAVAPPGSGLVAHLGSEVLATAIVFAVPTMLMGATFSHFVGLLTARGVGQAYALNTLGAALAPFVFGVWALPRLGYTDALYAVAYAYLAVFALFGWFRRFRTAWQIGAALIVVGATALGPRSLISVEPKSGWKLIERRETLQGVVMVSEDPAEKGPLPLRRLQIGRHFRMGGALAFGERRMGHLSMLMAEAPRSVLFLGLGTGATAGAAVTFPVERITGVELVPAVVDFLGHFDAINERVREDSRAELHVADARRYLAASNEAYDVIVGDLFHPAIDGASSLYAREHFQAAREHLAPGGVFVQWLPLHQLDVDTLAVLVRTFLAEFPAAHAILALYNVQTAGLGLLGWNRPDPTGPGLDLERLRTTLAQPHYRGLLELHEMLAGYMLDAEALRRFAGEGPLNLDLRPRVLFDAPATAYDGDDRETWHTLAALLPHRVPIPAGFVAHDDPGALAEFGARVEQYRRAAGAYLEGELARVEAGADAPPPAAAIAAYLAAYRHEPDFAPARGLLYLYAGRSPELAERILPPMFEITPNDVRLLRTYAGHLQRIGDEVRLQGVREAVERAAAAAGPQPT